MKGSILVTYDELIDNLGISNYNVYVNGVLRDSHFTDSDRLFSTECQINDIIQIEVIDVGDTLPVIDVIRRDYTTDSENGNDGIYDNDVPFDVITQTGLIYKIQFTATTVNNAYNFEFRVDIQEFFNPDCQITGAFGGFPITPSLPVLPVTINFQYVLNPDEYFNTNNSITYTASNLSATLYSQTSNCPLPPYNLITANSIIKTGTGAVASTNTIVVPYDQFCGDKLYFLVTRNINATNVGSLVKRNITTIYVNSNPVTNAYNGILNGNFINESFYLPTNYQTISNRYTINPGDTITITWVDLITNL